MALGDGHILRGRGMTSGRMVNGRGSSPSGARTRLCGGSVREARDPVLTPYGGLRGILLDIAVLGRPGILAQPCPSSAP